MENETKLQAETANNGKANVSRSKKLFVWDGVNGDMEEFKTIEEAQKFIKENFIEESEGIHPDIESVIILEQIFDTVVEEIQGKEEEYKVVFRSVG